MSVLISCEVGGEYVPPQWHALIEQLDRDGPTAPGTNQTDRSDTAKRANAKSQAGRTPTTQSQAGRSQGSRSGRTKRSSTLNPFRGPDPTAKYVAARMARRLGAPLVTNDHSSGLVDVRRSLHHRELFSPVTRKCPVADRHEMIRTIYDPYRQQLRTKLGRMLSTSAYVIHLSVESFPLGHGKDLRRADMGLLYDPSQQDEVDISLDWIDEMYEEIEMLRVRRNYPQRGTRDGITRAMRSEFADQDYIGIELMVNQAWAGREVAIRDDVIDGICWTLQSVLEIPQSKAA